MILHSKLPGCLVQTQFLMKVSGYPAFILLEVKKYSYYGRLNTLKYHNLTGRIKGAAGDPRGPTLKIKFLCSRYTGEQGLPVGITASKNIVASQSYGVSKLGSRL